MVSTWLWLGSQRVWSPPFPRLASHPALVGESDRGKVRKPGCSRSWGGRATWRSALLPTHTRARAVGPGSNTGATTWRALALGGRSECPAGRAGVAPRSPRSGRDSLRPDKERSPLSPFLQSLGPAGARVPQQSDALGGASVVLPVPLSPPSRVTVPLTSGGFGFIPWHRDFIFITACSAAELE